MTTWIVIGVIAALAAYVVVIYNGLVSLRNRVKNAFSQIDVQLQRRYDLIPNLVETAKGYMQHERETLEAVITARNQAQAAARRAEGDPADAGAMRELMGAEAALGGMLTRFFALAEAYPDLKANQNMALLQEELASTENRIAFTRQAYNDAVTTYNIKRESFPDSLIANNFGFKHAEQWQMDDTAAREPVKVSFTS
ncbi:MAG TPA: LemA family protein [Rhodocyclaceae bacterium]|nr:LemA family protein [Rhodocyclaceae bacterium]HRQ46652.1 LemA family protein [Rhodocyclaceae bacterium]